jgi:protein farnesyltransferase/geranylgeranyltransferase type-1 subunit alpha
MNNQDEAIEFRDDSSVAFYEEGPLSIDVSDEEKAFMRHFYAIVRSGHTSSVALEATTRMIDLNSASYTAWFWRRKSLEFLTSPVDRINSEIAFVDSWCTRNPKNYQVWYHRRWILESVCEYDYDTALLLLSSELARVEELILMEPKHYNAWTHRVFLATRFGLFSSLSELDFTEKMLLDDLRNNSAWNHRRHALTFHDERHADEVEFTVDKIRMAPNNESAWVYLRSLQGWEIHQSVIELMDSLILDSTRCLGESRDAVETHAIFREITGYRDEATRILTSLSNMDLIRHKSLQVRYTDSSKFK